MGGERHLPFPPPSALPLSDSPCLNVTHLVLDALCASEQSQTGPPALSPPIPVPPCIPPSLPPSLWSSLRPSLLPSRFSFTSHNTKSISDSSTIQCKTYHYHTVSISQRTSTNPNNAIRHNSTSMVQRFEPSNLEKSTLWLEL